MHVLSHGQQRIITQYFEMELSQEETARHLGVSRNQVKHAVTRLKKECRDLLGKLQGICWRQIDDARSA